MPPLVDELEVLVEHLHAVVRAVGDEQAPARVERQRVRAHELPRARAEAADGAHERAVRFQPHDAIAVLLRARRARPVAVGDDDVAVRRDDARGRTDERVGAGARDAGLAETEQQLAVLRELVQLKAAALRRRILGERPAVADPQVAVVIHAEAVCLHEQAAAEALRDRARRVDVVDRRLRAKHHPGAALVVGNDPDRGAPRHAVAQRRPALDDAIRIAHRRRRAASQLLERRRRRIGADLRLDRGTERETSGRRERARPDERAGERALLSLMLTAPASRAGEPDWS